ncbi:MAG: B12-binding domain-containing radical SAM protein [Promethearchaeota archaeon]|nr:MAG: B12-binding domain-containing radical SAM protein [Candidatus Lokiarchaeota archaeon]
MKIALIFPVPMDLQREDPRPMFSSFAEPLGLLYIAGVLMEHGYDVSILDHGATNYTFEDVLNWIKKQNPDILGISVLTRSFQSGITIAKLAKDWNPSLTIILGNYQTVCAEKILNKYNFIDFCVRGEGEYTMQELLPLIRKNNTDYESIKGIYYRKNGIVKSTMPRVLEKDLDRFPIPDRTLIKGARYKMSMGGLELSKAKSGTIMMSRGCPYQCRFCSVNHESWRHRSADNVIQELHLLESQGYREIMIMDDNFTINPKWVIEICKKIIKEKIDLIFHCEARIEGTKEMYEYMNRANVKTIFYGMESGSQRVLDYYQKNITPSQSKLALKKARSAGIDMLFASFIIGAPIEKISDIQKTVNFALNLDIDYAMFHIFEVFPGIQIWDELVEQNKVDEEKHWETGVRVAELPFYNIELEFLIDVIRRTYRKFYSISRPKFLFTQFLRSLKSQYRRNKLRDFGKDFRSSIRMLDSLSEKRF